MQPGNAEDTYQRFINDSGPHTATYYTRFYFFNITNLEDVRLTGAKPHLKELGPYTYRTRAEKYDVVFYYNGSISYKEKTFYYLEPSMTNGSVDDVILTLNMALVGVLDRLETSIGSWLARFVIGRIAAKLEELRSGTESGLFHVRTVKELLWGYQDALLSVVSRFSSVSSHVALMKNATLENGDDAKLPTSMIDSGLKNVEKIGQLEKWNRMTSTGNWNNYSEPVKGTAGTFFQPFLTGDEELCIWIPQMYRSMKLKKEKKSKLQDIRVFRYYIHPDFWARDDRYFDQYDGLVNVTGNSAGGSPGPALFFSPPYFCDADPQLSEGVSGIQCDHSDDHKFYIDVEPYTGISLRAAIRFMVSTEFTSKFTAIDPNLTQTVLPVFFLEEERNATETETERIRNDLYSALHLKDTLELVFLIVMIVAGALGVTTIACFLSSHLKKKLRCDEKYFLKKEHHGQLLPTNEEWMTVVEPLISTADGHAAVERC